MTTVFQEYCSFEDNGPDCTSVVGGGIFLKISRTAHDNHLCEEVKLGTGNEFGRSQILRKERHCLSSCGQQDCEAQEHSFKRVASRGIRREENWPLPHRYRQEAKQEPSCQKCLNSKFSLGGTFELTCPVPIINYTQGFVSFLLYFNFQCLQWEIRGKFMPMLERQSKREKHIQRQPTHLFIL